LALTPAPIETQALIIGAGPAGLFLAFQLGLQEIACQLVDVLPEPGGQCAALYPDKPIYDLPGLPVCSGRELSQRLLQQLRPFDPPLHLGQLVSSLQRQPDGRWLVHSRSGQHGGQRWLAPTVFIAAGVGAFVPRKVALPELEPFEHGAPAQVCYHDPPPEAALAAARHIVVHGGDAAAVELALALERAPPTGPNPITLLHRSERLQIEPALQASLDRALAAQTLQLVLGQPVGIVCGADAGAAGPAQAQREPDAPLPQAAAAPAPEPVPPPPTLQALLLATPGGGQTTLPCDLLLPRLGLSPKLGPLADWGLALQRKLLPVDSATMATAEPGLYAVGDINHYPGKRKLIVCAFHEATLAAFAAAAQLRPGQRQLLQYTTTSPRLQQLLGVGGEAGAG
jgi:thioredoxin reductase (NADPH)